MKPIDPLEGDHTLLEEETPHVADVSLSLVRLKLTFLRLESERLGNKYGKLLDLSAQQLNPAHGKLSVYFIGLALGKCIQVLPICLLVKKEFEVLWDITNYDIASWTHLG